MSFTRINTQGIKPSLAIDAARGLMDARKSNPMNTRRLYNRDIDDISLSIAALGGRGQLAQDLVSDWNGSPYLSLLRWGVTRSVGMNVEQELKKIQDRSNTIFYNSLARQYDEIEDKKTKQVFDLASQQKTFADAMAVASTFSDVRYDVHSYLEGYFGKIKIHETNIQKMAEFAEASTDPMLLKTIAAMSTLCQATEYLLNGNRTISLYRGICCHQGTLVYDSITQGASSIKIHIDHCASFTNHYKTAVDFAEGAGMSHFGYDHKGIVLNLNAPLYSLVATDTVFPALRLENECIVATNDHLEIKKSDITVLS